MPPPKSGSLGRGLGELIGGIPATIGSAATMSSTGFVRLSPDLIGVAPEREARAQEVAPDLVESVRTHGILQPILVRRRTQGYEVVIGARRLVAARLAGLKEIPAVVIQATDEEARDLSKVENTWWGNGNPVIPVAEPVVLAEAAVTGRCWTPGRLGLMCGAAILLWMLGAAAGLWLGRGHPRELAPSMAFVDDGSVETPRPTGTLDISEAGGGPPAEPERPQLVPGVEGAEFTALAGEGVIFEMDSNGLARVSFDEPLFSSRVALAEAGTGLLRKVGDILVRHAGDWDVVVTGHTDTTPLRGNGLYRDNKELGLARAVEVVRYLMREAGVPAAMLQAATAGEEHPPYPGEEAEARLKNRTVTLKVRLRQ